jgi:PAS domain S-box-containing protein
MSQIKLTKKDRPVPIDNEISIPENDEIISITDPKGIITDANEVFTRISGYKAEELIGVSHNVIRHPDMPKIMFKILWDRIKDKENIMAVVKNLAKDGSYYWVLTDFVTTVDKDRNVLHYTAYRKPINQKVKDAVIPLYKALCAIEELGGMELSERFLTDYFKMLGMTYDEMIEDIVINNCDKAKLQNINKETGKEKKQGFFEKFFGVKI